MVILINLSSEYFSVKPGMRIAQMVIARHEQANFLDFDILSETERDDRGFGHSGNF